MKNGGYVIVDLGGVNYNSGTPTKIKGIYNKINDGTKPLILAGIKIDDISYRDRFVFPDNVGAAYIVPISDVRYTEGATNKIMSTRMEVQENDTVTFKIYEG